MTYLACASCHRPTPTTPGVLKVTCGRCASILSDKTGPAPEPVLTPDERRALLRRRKRREGRA